MTVSFVNSNTAPNTNTGVLPPSIVSGDVLIWESTSVSGASPALPSGWTSLGSGNHTIYGIIDYTGSSPALNGSGLSGASNITISAWRGTKAAALLTNFAVRTASGLGVNSTTAPATLPSAPASTSLTVVMIGGQTSSAVTPSSTVPTGYTSQYNNNSATGWQQQAGTANTTTNPGTLTWGCSIHVGDSQDVCLLSIELPIGAVQHTTAATFDAALANRQTVTATADAVFANLVTKSATFDMVAAHPTLKTALADAVFAAVHTKAATFDADLMQTQFRTALADAVFARLTTKAATLDGVFAQRPAITALADAVFANLVNKTATTDAAFANLRTLSATFDADFSGQVFKVATFDAVFGYPELLPAGTATVVNSPMAGTATLAHLPPGTTTLPKLPPGSAVL